MRKTKYIAIILPDTLQSTGLQSLLTDYFHPVEIACFPSFESFLSTEREHFDYYFTQADIFVLNSDFFLPRRAKVIVNFCKNITPGTSAGYTYLNTCAPQELIIEQLQQVFSTDINNHSANEKNKDLSSREIDVLRLIVTGITNKDIAKKLNISLNTVLTHRKNITTKLGIKTVSGLTFYAIMNGLAPPDHIG